MAEQSDAMTDAPQIKKVLDMDLNIQRIVSDGIDQKFDK